MTEIVKIVRINLEEHASGLLCATSPDLPGMVITNRDLKKIRGDLPAVIKLMFKRRFKMDVEVREAATSDEKPRAVPNWVAIPAHIIKATQHAAA